jgi:hypothetical protein
MHGFPFYNERGPHRFRARGRILSARRPRARRPQLLVSLADGTLASLDYGSGALRWAFDTGAPLVSSTAGRLPARANDSASAGAGGLAVGHSIFPGTDGSLYFLHSGPDGQPHIQVRGWQLPLSGHRAGPGRGGMPALPLPVPCRRRTPRQTRLPPPPPPELCSACRCL